MLSMATSPAVTIVTIFMMDPLVLGTRAGWPSDALFRCVCARRPLLPSHHPAQSPGEWRPDYLSRQAGRRFKCRSDRIRTLEEDRRLAPGVASNKSQKSQPNQRRYAPEGG